jgi:hypothetical protein
MNWQIYDDKQILTVSIPLKMRVIEKKNSLKVAKEPKKKTLKLVEVKKTRKQSLMQGCTYGCYELPNVCLNNANTTINYAH